MEKDANVHGKIVEHIDCEFPLFALYVFFSVVVAGGFVMFHRLFTYGVG